MRSAIADSNDPRFAVNSTGRSTEPARKATKTRMPEAAASVASPLRRKEMYASPAQEAVNRMAAVISNRVRSFVLSCDVPCFPAFALA